MQCMRKNKQNKTNARVKMACRARACTMHAHMPAAASLDETHTHAHNATTAHVPARYAVYFTCRQVGHSSLLRRCAHMYSMRMWQLKSGRLPVRARRLTHRQCTHTAHAHACMRMSAQAREQVQAARDAWHSLVCVCVCVCVHVRRRRRRHYTIAGACVEILGHRSADSFATGPAMPDPFISPFGLTITPALSSK